MSESNEPIECEIVDSPPPPRDNAKDQAKGGDRPPAVEDPSKGLNVTTVDDTINGLIACNPRAFRDEATAKIISSLNLDKAREIKSLRDELGSKDIVISDLRRELSVALDNVRNLGADLKICQASLNTSRQDGEIQAVCGIVGTALLGVGFNVMEASLVSGLVLVIVGFVLISAGFIFKKIRK